jgi:hypothetical protein
LAFLAGIVTWLNRRGGCTSRTHRRDVEQNDDFMTENNNQTTAGGGMVASGAAAMQSSDNLPPPSPFQHARRFVPPTTNPTGYMNLTDEEYAYHNNGSNYQNYQDYQYKGDYSPQQTEYSSQQAYGHQDYYQQHEYQDPNYQQGYYNTNSNVTTPTLVSSVIPGSDGYHTQMKPDQVEQKPNAL